MQRNIKPIDLAIIAFFAAILFIQEYLLSFIPNISLTVFFIVLYSKKLGLIRTSLIVIIYTILDALAMGALNIIFTPFTMIGWLIIPLTLNTVFKGVNSPLKLALLGVLYSFLYCWVYIIPNTFYLKIEIIPYLISDILFEVILASSSFISILCLYNPCSQALDKILSLDKKNP